MKDKLIATLTEILGVVPDGKRDGANLTMAQALEILTIGYEVGNATGA